MNNSYEFLTANWKAVAAVYVIFNSKKQAIYVGQTDDLKRRMSEHRADMKHRMHKYGPALVSVEVVAGEATRRSREAELIGQLNPPANRQLA